MGATGRKNISERMAFTDGTARWNPPQTDFRKKQRAIWTRYGVFIIFSSGILTQPLTISTAMTASQMRIAETIDAFYGDAGANDGVSRSYKQAVEDLDAETIKALDGPFRYALT